MKRSASLKPLDNREMANANDNNRIQTFVYLQISKMNKHFMEGTFSEGLALVPQTEEKLKEYGLYLDRHRISGVLL